MRCALTSPLLTPASNTSVSAALFRTKFNLAWGLTKSNDAVEVAEGVQILMSECAQSSAASLAAALTYV